LIQVGQNPQTLRRLDSPWIRIALRLSRRCNAMELAKGSMTKHYGACAVICGLLFFREGFSQIRWPDLLKDIPFAGASEKEAGQGVKEALAQGVTRAVLNLHKTDGFFRSDLYKVLLPPDAQKAQNRIGRAGR
jgi:hypothetical protein